MLWLKILNPLDFIKFNKFHNFFQIVHVNTNESTLVKPVFHLLDFFAFEVSGYVAPICAWSVELNNAPFEAFFGPALTLYFT